MASIDELNADFVAAYNDLIEWLATEVPDRNLPFVGNIRDILRGKINSPEGRTKLLELVKDVVATDEKWRAAHPQQGAT